MKEFLEGVINFIFKVATGTKRIRVILAALFGSVFFCIVLLLIFSSFYLDSLLGLTAFIAKPFRI